MSVPTNVKKYVATQDAQMHGGAMQAFFSGLASREVEPFKRGPFEQHRDPAGGLGLFDLRYPVFLLAQPGQVGQQDQLRGMGSVAYRQISTMPF